MFILCLKRRDGKLNKIIAKLLMMAFILMPHCDLHIKMRLSATRLIISSLWIWLVSQWYKCLCFGFCWWSKSPKVKLFFCPPCVEVSLFQCGHVQWSHTESATVRQTDKFSLHAQDKSLSCYSAGQSHTESREPSRKSLRFTCQKSCSPARLQSRVTSAGGCRQAFRYMRQQWCDSAPVISFTSTSSAPLMNKHVCFMTRRVSKSLNDK